MMTERSDCAIDHRTVVSEEKAAERGRDRETQNGGARAALGLAVHRPGFRHLAGAVNALRDTLISVTWCPPSVAWSSAAQLGSQHPLLFLELAHHVDEHVLRDRVDGAEPV